jgi:hypothetical protein
MTEPKPPSAERQMSAEEYLGSRLKQYQSWYDTKAATCKRRYIRMRCAVVLSSAIVPVLVNLDFEGRTGITTGLSLLVVVVVSLEGVLHYREQWKNYRSTEQYLGREEQWFRARVGPYASVAGDRAVHLLVERVEAAIASENAATLNVMTLGPREAE